MHSEWVATAIRMAVKYDTDQSLRKEDDADAQEEKNVLVNKCWAA